MPVGSRSEADYLSALQALLPQGRAWPRDPGALLTALLDGFAKSYALVDAKQTNLLIDAFPETTIELLPEWESSLGLPDPCAGQQPTLELRRAQVVARLTTLGGQSIAALTAFAAALGYTVTITEYTDFRAGISHAGDNVNSAQDPRAAIYFTAGGGRAGDPLAVWEGGTPGYDWAYGLNVHSGSTTVKYFSAGTGSAGEPLATWGNAVLECELKRVQPAEAILIFSYS